jgi:hypothetical protein
MGLISPERDLLRPVAVPHAPPLSRDEHNARRRAHRRAKQAADEAIQPKQARKRPVAQADYRLCMRCRRRKLYSEFGSWRIRVCLACDGPTLEEIIMNPQRVRSIPEDC